MLDAVCTLRVSTRLYGALMETDDQTFHLILDLIDEIPAALVEIVGSNAKVTAVVVYHAPFHFFCCRPDPVGSDWKLTAIFEDHGPNDSPPAGSVGLWTPRAVLAPGAFESAPLELRLLFRKQDFAETKPASFIYLPDVSSKEEFGRFCAKPNDEEQFRLKFLLESEKSTRAVRLSFLPLKEPDFAPAYCLPAPQQSDPDISTLGCLADSCSGDMSNGAEHSFL